MTFLRMSRDTAFATIGAVLYALVAFGVHVQLFPIGDLGVESDFYAELVVSAQRLAAGDFAVANYPFKGPLHSFLLIVVHGVAGPLGADWYRSAVLLNALCASVTLVVVYRLQRRLFGAAVAVTTTLALAFTYEFFLHAHKASSDLLYLLLYFATVKVTIHAGATWRRAVAAGVLAGLAFLTRYSGGVLVVGAMAGFFLLPDSRESVGRPSARAGLKRSGAFLLGLLIVGAPWFLANMAETGRPLSTGNLTNVVQEFYAGDRQDEIPVGGFGSLWEVIAHDPVFFVTRLASNVPRNVGLDMSHVVGRRIWPLVVAGWAGLLVALVFRTSREWALRRRPSREQWAFFVFAGCSFLAMCLVFHRPRFSLPLVPAYFTLCYGVLFGLDGRPLAGMRRWVTWAAVVLAVVVTAQQAANIVGGERYYYERRPLEVLRRAPAVRELARRSGSHTIMARKPHLAHYAGLNGRRYPGAVSDWGEFLGRAYDQGVDLIVVGSAERTSFPDAAFLDQLDRAAGVDRVADDDGFTVFRLDRSLSRHGAAALPAADDLRRRIREAERAGDGAAAFGSHSELSFFLMPLGMWSEAAASLTACLELAAAAPGAVSAADADYLKVNLAFCRLQLSDYEAGIALLGPNLGELSPTGDASRSGRRHFVLARLLAAAGRYPEARRQFQLSIAQHRKAGRDDAARDVAVYLRAIDGR